MSPSFTGHDPLFQWVGWAREPLALRLSFEGVRLVEGEWTLPPISGSDPPTAAIDALHATDYPARFKLIDVAGRRVIVPETVRNVAGVWVPTTSLLDTPIDLEPYVRDPNDALNAWSAALEARTGQRVLPGQVLNGDGVTDAGGIGIPARDLLVEILADRKEGYGPSNQVWSLVWYERGQYWLIHFWTVWSLEPPDGPPPPTPVPAQPPRR